MHEETPTDMVPALARQVVYARQALTQEHKVASPQPVLPKSGGFRSPAAAVAKSPAKTEGKSLAKKGTAEETPKAEGESPAKKAKVGGNPKAEGETPAKQHEEAAAAPTPSVLSSALKTADEVETSSRKERAALKAHCRRHPDTELAKLSRDASAGDLDVLVKEWMGNKKAFKQEAAALKVRAFSSHTSAELTTTKTWKELQALYDDETVVKRAAAMASVPDPNLGDDDDPEDPKNRIYFHVSRSEKREGGTSSEIVQEGTRLQKVRCQIAPQLAALLGTEASPEAAEPAAGPSKIDPRVLWWRRVSKAATQWCEQNAADDHLKGQVENITELMSSAKAVAATEHLDELDACVEKVVARLGKVGVKVRRK